MMAFTRKDRQRIIDGYLAATGRNLFHPGEFVDWLRDQPEHEMHEAFFGQGDEEAARQHRISMARQMASGLRLSIPVSKVPDTATVVSVATREYPALISPVAGRSSGGGYQPFDPEDSVMVDELRRQGAQALAAWLRRYRGVLEQSGVSVTPIEKTVAQLESAVAGAA